LRNQYQMVGKNDEIQELAISPTARPGSQLVGVMAMKNAEPMEQAPKSTELVLASDEAGGLEMPSVADQRRRRLVRGAAAFAPVVLTLRSGALAAASCTGARTVNTTLDNSSKPDSSVGAQQGDVCFKVTDVNTCPGAPNKLENGVGSPTPYVIGNNGKCGNLTGGTQVAILSSTAADSFAR
jgi:hypothetical protein